MPWVGKGGERARDTTGRAGVPFNWKTIPSQARRRPGRRQTDGHVQVQVQVVVDVVPSPEPIKYVRRRLFTIRGGGEHTPNNINGARGVNLSSFVAQTHIYKEPVEDKRK